MRSRPIGIENFILSIITILTCTVALNGCGLSPIWGLAENATRKNISADTFMPMPDKDTSEILNIAVVVGREMGFKEMAGYRESAYKLMPSFRSILMDYDKDSWNVITGASSSTMISVIFVDKNGNTNAGKYGDPFIKDKHGQPYKDGLYIVVGNTGTFSAGMNQEQVNDILNNFKQKFMEKLK
jgi:hypothetical protein